MLTSRRKIVPEYTTPLLTVTSLNLSGRLSPLPVTLNAATYGTAGKYTVLGWTSVAYPAGYTGANAFSVAPPAGTQLTVRDVSVVSNQLIVELSDATIAT